MKEIPLSTISYGSLVNNWCTLPYPGHPEGCPNYGDKDWCPPKVAQFPSGLDVSHYNLIKGHNGEMSLLKLKAGAKPTMWLFIWRFDLGAFARGLQSRHKRLSEKQARIPYLWHTKVYESIYAEANRFRWTLEKPTVLLRRPEANGVNLFATCRANGGPQLEKNPRETVYLMAMVGLA